MGKAKGCLLKIISVYLMFFCASYALAMVLCFGEMVL
jgi:hypothetical protein